MFVVEIEHEHTVLSYLLHTVYQSTNVGKLIVPKNWLQSSKFIKIFQITKVGTGT